VVAGNFKHQSGQHTFQNGTETAGTGFALNGLFRNDRPSLERVWDDVKPFAEYGCTRDPKFFDRMKGMMLYKTTDGEYLTVEEYLEKNQGKGEENTVYYSNDPLQQIGYINLFREQGLAVIVMDGILDSRFLSFLEMQDHAVHFVRIDSELDRVLRGEDEAEENEALLQLFRDVVPEKVRVVQEVMKSTKTPALLTLAEEKRRLGEILKQYGENIPGISLPEDEITLVVNMNCPLIARIAALASEEKSKEKAKVLAKQVYMIAVVANRSFTQEELQDFVDSSIDLLYNA
jgi:molecular chaperone HtpG